jgi:hypothetical protein
MNDTKVWSIEVVFTEDEDRTRADAVLTLGSQRFHGWGRSRRNPTDPDVPKIGEEIAAARALTNLSGKLIHAAADAIEAVEGHPVKVHT